MYKIQNLGISLYRYRKHRSNKTKQLKSMESFKKKLFKQYDLDKKQKYKKSEYLDFPVAIIPARLGSLRLKEKNLKRFKNKPLIYWSIEAAKKSKYIKKIFVTSES